MKRQEYATIETQSHAGGIYTMSLHAPGIVTIAKPGQFVMVYLDEGEHLLPRPISIHDVDKAKGILTLVYVVAGAGTKIISEWPVKRTVRLLGPLGNGFTTEDFRAGDKIALVGGGFGAAPLYYLAKELKKAGVQPDVYLGFRKSPQSLVQCFERLTESLIVATEEPESKYNGVVTNFLPQNPDYTAILSCGPAPMLKALASYAHTHNIPCQVSVEERMACGLGACKGCIVKTLVGYQLCCLNGPVFDSREVIFS